MKKVRAKKGAWFYKVRGSYLPSSWQGVAVYFVYLAYIVALPVAWYRNGHELWSLLAFVVPLWIAAALVAQFIASKNTR